MLVSDPYHLIDVLAVSVGASLVIGLIRSFFLRTNKTNLSGPKRHSWLYGYNADLLSGRSGDYFESWQKEFGDVYNIPSAGGGERAVFMDPRAISYILNTHAYNFVRHTGSMRVIKRMLGGGILTVEGEHHKRHRKSMSPGFTPAAIRFFTTVFLEAAYKVKDEWLALMASQNKEEDLVIDVEPWLNSISLDSIGLAGFSHDFKAIGNDMPHIGKLFTAMGAASDKLSTTLILALMQAFPIVAWMPFKRNQMFDTLNEAMRDVAKSITTTNRKTVVGDASDERRSLVASIIKAENRHLTESEVVAEINTLLLAGFETTSVTMAWCLHELSINTHVQTKLREELALFPTPTHEQLANEMKYLDAVVKETLRTHPAVQENHRLVAADDTIPLLTPITTADGKQVDHIQVRAGMGVVIPIEAMNTSPAIWGPDGREFKPERWLQGGLPKKAMEIQGYNHLMTFIDGPRHCIGKNFAVAEFKAALAVLVANFSFLPWTDGHNVRRVRTLVPRIRNTGVDGLMLRVSKVNAE